MHVQQGNEQCQLQFNEFIFMNRSKTLPAQLQVKFRVVQADFMFEQSDCGLVRPV